MRTALALVLGALVLPASAAAATVVTLRPFPGPELREGPFIIGAGVGWAQERCISDCADPESGDGDGRYLIRSAGPAGRLQTLFRAHVRHDVAGPHPLQEAYSAWLSPATLAVLRRASDGRLTLRTGRPGGPLQRLFDCSSDGIDVPVALDGHTLVYEPDPCSAPVRLAVRDVASGAERVVPLTQPENPVSLQVAGRFAAWLRYQQGGLHVIVFDLNSGTTTYAAPFEPPAGWALGEDGTVAATTGSTRMPCRGRVSWYSVAEPVRHQLSVPACIGRVRVENGRIFFVGPRRGARFLRSAGVAGNVRDHVRFGRVAHRDFDVRGKRIAWAVRDCGGGDSIFGGRIGRGVLGVGPVGCPASLAPGPATVRRSRVDLRFNCPRGCAGNVALIRKGRPLADRPFGLPPGRRSLKLILLPAARTLLARHGSLRVRADLTVRDRAFRPHRTARTLLLVPSTGSEA